MAQTNCPLFSKLDSLPILKRKSYLKLSKLILQRQSLFFRAIRDLSATGDIRVENVTRRILVTSFLFSPCTEVCLPFAAVYIFLDWGMLREKSSKWFDRRKRRSLERSNGYRILLLCTLVNFSLFFSLIRVSMTYSCQSVRDN